MTSRERCCTVIGVARKKSNPDAWTPNQIVGYRVALARQMRGWTQEQASAELEPFLGQKLSPASFSAIERSFAGGRIRQFNADEILALARGFQLPIGWFFTPPPVMDGIGIETPDAPEGFEPLLLIDAMLGNDDTLPEWIDALKLWAVSPTRVRIYDDGRMENRGTEIEDVYEEVDKFTRARAQVRLGELLGDTDRAKQVLGGLIGLLEELDAGGDEPAPENTKRKKGKGG